MPNRKEFFFFQKAALQAKFIYQNNCTAGKTYQKTCAAGNFTKISFLAPR